jgi:DnaK suppressor protein
VQALVEAGARQALHDIELALARIRTGVYGGCRRCGAAISLAVLEAIPQTTLCQRCHRRGNGAEVPKSAAHVVLAGAAAPLGEEALGGSEASG